MIRMIRTLRRSTLAACVGLGMAAQAEPLLNFPFNEGSGTTTTDTVNGLVGVLGVATDPEVDTVTLVDQSPSGQAGDRSILTAGSGFLMADDSETKSLNITNGPITMETWMFIDPATPAPSAEGILAYGGSYKMGLRSGIQVFTLFGIVDINNNAAGPIVAGQWVHLAAAWEPGVGVHFFVDGVEYFEPNTNTAARPVQHNYLSLASEGLGNNSDATFDRMRIHHALLTADQIDSVAATPKAPLPTTLVSYDFNQATLPATNSVAPPLPAVLSSTLVPALTGPAWTSDTPSGAEGDFALAFLSTNPPVKEVVTVNYGETPIDLGANDTNYTLQVWVKLPPGLLDERRVIYRTDGPGPRISLSINVNRTLHTTVLGTADFTTSVSVPDDQRWHHIAVVMENFDQLHFYLDGVLRQTVTRTQQGAASAGGTPRLLIGKESETRYFRGVLDRVIIHNNALQESELDYPAVPGAPTFDSLDSHPAAQVADAGSTVTFTATPTSATTAGYQWFYRTNLADVTGVPVAGQTSTTLTLNNVGPQSEGFYYLVATNAAGRAESYAARLLLSSTLALTSTGFEAPEFTVGTLEGQNHWRTEAVASIAPIARVMTAEQITELLNAAGVNPAQPVHGGTQALVVGGAFASSSTIRQITGLEDDQNVTLDFWVRPLSGATTGNFFITAENGSGTRAAAVRFGPAGSIDYGTDIQGVWQPTGLTWDGEQWYRITMEIDYASKTYDFLVNGTAVNTEPIPFYTATADRFSQIRIFRGSNQVGGIIDDLSVTGSGGTGGPTLAIREQADALVISWPAAETGFVLQATDELVPANWTTVPHTTQGAENQAVIQPAGDHRFFRLVQQ